MNGFEDPTIQINRTTVGRPGSVYVIAEVGVNHNGHMGCACQLIETAVEAGADAVKFQCFSADRLVTRASPTAAYQQHACRMTSQHEVLRRLELRHDQLSELADEARRYDIDFLATPFSVLDLEFLVSIEVAAIKLASTDIVNGPLLDAAADAGLPVIASTGASTLDEVRQAVERMRVRGLRALALLHCISSYPAPEWSVNLAAVGSLGRRFGCVSGFSDHTQSVETGRFAVLAGARIIEKHLTLDRNSSGPDHAFSLEPAAMKSYVRAVRQGCQLLGDGQLRMTPEQEDVRRVARGSLVADRDIAAGQVMTRSVLTVKRPGEGISPMQIEQVLGRTTLRAIPADTHITWDALCPLEPVA